MHNIKFLGNTELCVAAKVSANAYTQAWIPPIPGVEHLRMVNCEKIGFIAHVVRHGPILYVAVAGTHFRDLRDWVVNFDTRSAYLSVLSGDVHRGFMKAAEVAHSKLLTCLVDEVCAGVRTEDHEPFFSVANHQRSHRHALRQRYL